MALPQKKHHTTEDIYALPEGQRAELIDGQMYMMAPPNFRHQKIIMELSSVIHQYIKTHGGNCEVIPAPFAVFLNKDEKNYVEPDILIVCEPSKLDEKGCHGAPDWVIEIVSPGSRSMDYFTKLFKYRTAAVREYWIVDPIKQRVTVYFFEKESVEEYSCGDTVPVGIYEGFSLQVQ